MAETFGQTLRELRRSKGISQRNLAEKVGVDFSYISKVENDRLPPPAANTIVKICEALSVPYLEVMNKCSQTRISQGFSLIVDDSGHRKSAPPHKA